MNGVGTSGAPGQYFEGKDAGTLQLYGTRLVLDGSMLGDVTRGEFQRAPTTALTGSQRPGRPGAARADNSRWATQPARTRFPISASRA